MSLIARSNEAFTSLASKVEPSEKVTPLRRWKRQVPLPWSSHDSASRGITPWPAFTSYWVSVSLTFSMMIRPMFDRVAMQGSIRSMSSPSTMVTSLPSWAKAGANGSSASAEDSSRVVRFIRFPPRRVVAVTPEAGDSRAVPELPSAPTCQPDRHLVNMIQIPAAIAMEL